MSATRSQTQLPRISPPTLCFLLKHLLECIGTMTQPLSSRNQNLQLRTPSTKWSSGPTLNRPNLGSGSARFSGSPAHACMAQSPPTRASAGPRQEHHLTEQPRTHAEHSPNLRLQQYLHRLRLVKCRPRRSATIAHPHSQTSFSPRPCACTNGTPNAAPPLTNLGATGSQPRPGLSQPLSSTSLRQDELGEATPCPDSTPTDSG